MTEQDPPIVHELVPDLLRAICDEMRGMRIELTQELRDLRGEFKVDLAEVSSRLDKLIENTGGHWRGLSARVDEIEARVRKLEG